MISPDEMAQSPPPCLEMKNIVKQFPRVLANDNVSIRLEEGEILALLGENGAGKSTLMNILYGLYKPTSGQILLGDEEVTFSSPRDAIWRGLGMVHQHFMLVDTLTVTENIILGTEPGRRGVIDYKKAQEDVATLSRRYHLDIDPTAMIENLSVGLQQRVEILKTLYRRAKILILDEPTAVLTPQEVEELFQVVKILVDSGVSIILITHKLAEVKEISDRVYILRRGKVVGTHNTADVTKTQLANEMVGREVVLTATREARKQTSKPSFKVEELTIQDERGVQVLRRLSLNVRPGEIVGIAGVDGNGQTELAEAIRGLRKVQSGRMLFKGEDVTDVSTRGAIARRMAYVPSDRHRFGLILPFSVAENIVLGYHLDTPNAMGPRLNFEHMEKYSEELVKAFDIRTPGTNVPAENLSGGNQQKVILAREFSHDPEFLLVSQPTRGLDVGAIEYIHSQILKMRDRKVAILLISLELEEVFALSDRILVLYEGEIVKEFLPEETNEREVGLFMTGGRGKGK